MISMLKSNPGKGLSHVTVKFSGEPLGQSFDADGSILFYFSKRQLDELVEAYDNL
tara:strand:- start:265 stop:429 length:165 start_codon:yes stop_codon:yes gene_type:complete